MKKLFLAVASVMLAFSVSAAPHQSFSFLNPQVKALMVTNATSGGTYGGGVTNLSISALWQGSDYITNCAFTRWTNFQGVLNLVSNTSGAYPYTQGTNANLLGSAPLWSLTDGSPASSLNLTNTTYGSQTIGYGMIHVRALFVDADHDAGLQFRFGPSPDGVNVSTNQPGLFTFTVMPGGTLAANTWFDFTTNAPMHLWVGARSLYLLDITNPEVEADCKAWVTDVSINGFVP
jgi:hypothetical protein